MSIKRVIVAAIVAASLAGAAFAFANSLTVSSGTLASGTKSVDSGCTSLKVDWASAWSATNQKYDLTSITLTGAGPACTTQAFKATVADGAGASIHEYTGSLTAGAATITVPAADSLHAGDVGNVTAVITGAAA